ncbi:MaoC family dehydratase [Novosphingobium pentaromativorans]|nr:MaoC family dehydratase [Novosphingobium pentaromativorans]AIT80570.1 acyl dehydratase [Novosphingobium pentaromativorans US6-1]
MNASRCPEQLGQGHFWQDLSVGQRFRTLNRTVTEADLVNFIGATGMLEAIFIDATFDGAMEGRAVPGALTCGLIEGLQFQTLLQATGLAMLEMTIKAVKPVFVGDTIHAIVTIEAVRQTSRGGRGLVESSVDIRNQRGETVMTYTAKRLIAGRPD